MSIKTANRTIALEALKLFERVPEEKLKDYRNAVQKPIPLMGPQGLKRMVLYLSPQMGKEKEDGDEEKKVNDKNKADTNNTGNAWQLLYNHLACFSGIGKETFQYKIVLELDEEQAALKEESIAFFLLCLKRLANAKLTGQEPPKKSANHD